MTIRKVCVLVLSGLVLCASHAKAQEEATDSQSSATSAAPGWAGPTGQAATLQKEITAALGLVPTMFRLIPDEALAGAWQDFKNLQMNPKTALSGKDKELIGSAVAAQIPCHYCSYFHRQVNMELNKASDREVREAIAVAALTRKFSAVLNGIGQPEASFKSDVDKMFRAPASRAPASAGGTSGESSERPPMQARQVKTPDEVYQEAKRLWGFVPQFVRQYPREGLVGAWNEYVGLEMNPNTAIPNKTKSLISLAVAAQVPCSYCVIMDKRAAKAEGATDGEINEAIAMASMTRHWSTILNGNLIDETAFRKETDQIISNLKAKQAAGTGVRAPASEAPPAGTTSDEGTDSGQ